MTDPNIKLVICVDDDVDVFNETQVLWALAMRFQADRDLVIIPNIIGSHLNPTAYGYNRMEKGPMETKLIFDATKPMPPYDFPKEAQAPDEVLKKLTSRGIRALTSRAGRPDHHGQVMIRCSKGSSRSSRSSRSRIVERL